LLKKAHAVKLLGEGEISYPIRIKVNKASQTAKKKIESAGGEIEIA
jgi:large subunit ribosomal protein L15